MRPYGNKKNGTWTEIVQLAGVKRLFCLKKKIRDEDTLVLEYLVYTEGIAPLNENNIVRITFNGYVYVDRTYKTEVHCNYAEGAYWCSNETGDLCWIGEVTGSRFLQWFNDSIEIPETFEEDVKHYCIIAMDDTTDIITSEAPLIEHIKGKRD